MKRIFGIFIKDLKGICTHFFVLVVVIGICALPALYAWFNIYANWDPYENTGQVQLAAAIEDEGWTDEKGNSWNLGEEVKKDLAASKSLNWVFVDSDEEAQEGVRSGKYYAAISLNKDFSHDMFADFGEKNALPELTYYLNDKKNAVATKISDAAVESVQTSINEKYISITTSRLFGDLKENVPAGEVQTDVQEFIEKLGLVKENLDAYKDMIGTFMESNDMLAGVLEKTAGKLDDSGKLFDDGSAKLASTAQELDSVSESFNAFNANVTGALSAIQGEIDSLASQISGAQLQADAEAVKARINEMLPMISELREDLDTLLNAIMALDPEEIPWQPAADQIKDLQSLINIVETNATRTAAVTAAEELADSIHASLSAMSASIGSAASMFTDSLIPSVNQLISSLQSSMSAMENVLSSLGSTVRSLSGTLLKMEDTTNTLNTGMPALQDILEKTGERITELIEKTKEVAYSEKLERVMEFLSGDASAIGSYFAEPVRIEDHYVYEIANYGSGVAPFYTALAIWVGMTILVSVLKVHPDKKAFPDAKRRELFFGRYLLFLVLSEAQTAVIVAGELCWLKIQCLYPELYVLAAMAASLTISLIIYALTVSFGDIGKAIALIALIIQIAGSGGTYPIEILPSFFRSAHLLFPFPYIIDAMRECIGGMYDGTYVRCLLSLAVFCGAALVLGLLIRLPFISVNRFVEKRLEDTELM